MSRPPDRPPGFLDLPKELRLSIYELLPNRIGRTEYTRFVEGRTVSSFTLISSLPPVEILATCKLVKEEAELTVRSSARRISQGPLTEELDLRLSGPAPRIETQCHSLEFLASREGLIHAVTEWFKELRQGRIDQGKSRFTAKQYPLISVFHSYGYAMLGGTTEQGSLRAQSFVCEAGWTLYHRSQECSLDEFQRIGCSVNEKGVFKLRGPMMHIALTQKDTNTANEFFGVVGGFFDLIEELESTYGVCFLVHLLSGAYVTDKESQDAWQAVCFAVSDIVYGGYMEGPHGFLKEGVFELDKVEAATYRRYWHCCEQS